MVYCFKNIFGVLFQYCYELGKAVCVVFQPKHPIVA